jgi:glycosyltransferase involved in cell wall biosynthesis
VCCIPIPLTGGSFWRKLLLALPALLIRVPVIVHLHAGGFVEFHANGSAWRRACMRLLFRRAFRVVVLSDEWKQWAQCVEPATRVTVVPNSLAISTGAQCGSMSDDHPTILFLGRVGDAKGTFDLLRAFAAVRQQIPLARLVIGGDGDIKRLNTEVAELDLADAVKYVGWVAGAAKSRLLAACWVFALPSYKEGLPVGILEAMAYARAVVASPVGGIPHAVDHGVTGLLVQPGDVKALVSNLLVVLSSRAEAQRLGLAARQAFIRKFSHDANLPKILALYREAGAVQLPVLHIAEMKGG